MGVECNKRSVGKRYEQVAVAYLKECGYDIVETNFYTRAGEIDIIAKDGNELVFVEVKYRRNTLSGYPEEAVDYRKQQKIYQSARYYLYKRRLDENISARFDVVSITGDKIKLYKNAFYIM